MSFCYTNWLIGVNKKIPEKRNYGEKRCLKNKNLIFRFSTWSAYLIMYQEHLVHIFSRFEHTFQCLSGLITHRVITVLSNDCLGWLHTLKWLFWMIIHPARANLADYTYTLTWPFWLITHSVLAVLADKTPWSGSSGWLYTLWWLFQLFTL